MMSGIDSIPRHRVFISYHDGRKDGGTGDHASRVEFERRFGGIFEAFVSGAVQDGDIDLSVSTEATRQRIRDHYLRNTSVTLVLVGARTWQRKHVDWEIGASLRHTDFNPRSGLLGILLPSYPGYPDRYDPHTIPPRLHDNLEHKYATLHAWTDDPVRLNAWIHAAFQRRNQVLPDNTRVQFAQNRTGPRWTD